VECEEVLGKDDEAGFGFDAVEATAVEALELAVSFGVTKGSFDHGSTRSMNSFRFRRFHLFLVSLQNLLAFQTFDCPARTAWAKALGGQRTVLANLRRTLKPVLDHELRITA
jgi:hypothetical protein